MPNSVDTYFHDRLQVDAAIHPAKPTVFRRLAGLKGDAIAGLVVALLSLPMTIPLGVLALSPLGPDYTVAGVIAGFHSSILAGTVSALCGGSRFQISGPRASVSLIMATAITLALGDPRIAVFGLPPKDAALTVGFMVVFLAGLVQVGLGLIRAGYCQKYVPYPVLSGFMNGVAVLIVLGQLPAAMGLTGAIHWDDPRGTLALISVPSVIIALFTMGVMWLTPRFTRKVPPLVLAFAAGIALDHLLRLFWGDAVVGPLVGHISGDFPRPLDVSVLSHLTGGVGDLLGLVVRELPIVFVLAMVGSLESLLSASTLDTVTHTRHNSNRELIGQGLGNMAAACFGGVPSTGAPMRGIASFRVGGTSRGAGALHSMALLAALLWGTSLLAVLPYSVMAGIMIMVALVMTDSWAFGLLRKGIREFGADFLVVLVVATVTVLANLAVAVLIGIGIAIMQFVFRMSRPIVRRVYDRTVTKSRRVRSLAVEELLKIAGHSVVVVELDGPLFFGTAEALRGELEKQAGRQLSVIILELRRVPTIDLSGARILQQLGRAQAALGRKVFLSGVHGDDAQGLWLNKTGVARDIPIEHWFANLDRALEAAEDLILGDAEGGDGRELPLESLAAMGHLDPDDMAALKKYLRRRVYAADEVVFRKGEDCDGLYLLVRGFTEVRLPKTDTQPQVRLATFAPGTILGELALLDGGPRSADAIATVPVTAHHLSMDDFIALRRDHPGIATQLLMNIAKELADRLRLTNARLQSAE